MKLQISGSHLTETSRRLVQEGRFQDAINLLKNSLQGIDNEYIELVLSGKCQLTGVDIINLIEDQINNESWLEEQYSVYFEDIVKIDNNYYKVYDTVSAIYADSVEKVMEKYDFYTLPINVNNKNHTYAFSSLRAKSYCKNKTDQVVYSTRTLDWLLLEKIEFELPKWLTESDIENLLKKEAEETLGFKYSDISELQSLIASMFEHQKETNNFKSTRSNERDEVIDNYLSDQKEAEGFSDKVDDYKAKISDQANKKGGAGSHLSIVSREFGFTLLQIEKAKEKLPEGANCQINFNEGLIETLNIPLEEIEKLKKNGEIFK